MLNLILKDVLIQKKYLLVSVLYALFFTLCFKSNPSMAFGMIPMMIAYILIAGACGFDDKNKCEIMLNSLPIDRTNLVISKYLSTILFIFIGIALAFTFSTILNFSGFIHMDRLMNLEDVFGATIGTLIMSCLYFPLYFKFGNQKARYVLAGIFMFIFAISIFLTNKIAKAPISFMAYLNNQPDWLIATFIAIIAAILFLISILLSIKFYINKDL
ncbi:ABC-2 transporter permease [Clostridium sp. P21]|uniref:ABC-2 transporter permease n=1 Tax=Clostridium muellerianum TaxID=2716538 RepID=A0A7Y0EJS4_9CLOT|nr:ABC-2 transporter permease [Clostridium muellerianum]NMM64768.1 ABC-2 transporter permease [Clostridium muellerianum]